MKYKLLLFSLLILLAMACLSAASADKPTLKVHDDGMFKILLISDLHYGVVQRDRYSLDLIERLIDTEKADLVVVNGDCVSGDRAWTMDQLKTLVSYVGEVMEKKRVPWAITFGNHDPETFPKTGITKSEIISIYESHPYNVNDGWTRDISGVGNKYLLIWNKAGTMPVMAVWLLDSADRGVRADQTVWYYNASQQLEFKYGFRIPGLMFMHIPIPEISEMAGSIEVQGSRRSGGPPSWSNSGMFAAIRDRGDVRGVFFGHAHMNDFTATWKGVRLGFDLGAGFGSFPHISPEDPANARYRGGRVFLVKESDPAHFETWMRYNDGTKGLEPPEESFFANTSLYP